MSTTVQPEIGCNAYKWAGDVLGESDLPKEEMDRKFSRKSLFVYCENPASKTEHAVLSILAWGGMNRKHGKLLFENPDKEKWLLVAEKIRDKTYTSREEAYKSFWDLRNNGLLPGLGIAYFTKLICFLNRHLDGYIMDQWTSKSVNLLTGQNDITLLSGWVHDSNDAKVFGKFCQRVEHLSKELNCSPLEAEERIFSKARAEGNWRCYVKSRVLK